MTTHVRESANALCSLEAVRCKFRLTLDELDPLFASWLREVFLAERRVAAVRMKPGNNGEQDYDV